MSLPTQDEISVNRTKRHVDRVDINNFGSYLGALKDVVAPFTYNTRNCEMGHIVEDGHVIETAVGRLNEEIARMINWSSRDVKGDIEKLAKNFVDIRTEYLSARNSIEHCTCKRTR